MTGMTVSPLAIAPKPRAIHSCPLCGPVPDVRSLPGGAPGQVLAARYRLERIIEQTPQASAWRAIDQKCDSPVMAWVLPAYEPVPVRVTAAALDYSTLSDPRVACVLDADCTGDQPFIVAQWPTGRRLEDLIRSGLPSPAAAAVLTAAVADVLATVHAAGQAHLLLTPRSVRCGADGVMLTGLGIEAALAGPRGSGPVTENEAAVIDARALAAMFYALLTGYWPGTGWSALPPAPRSGESPRPPGELRPDLPWAYDLLLSCALSPGRDPRALSPARFSRELRAARRACGQSRRGHRDLRHWISGLPA